MVHPSSDRALPSISDKVRKQRIALAVGALLYSAISYHFHTFFLPNKHGKGIILHGPAASFLETALVFAAIASVLPLFARQESAGSMKQYEQWRRGSACIAYLLVGLGGSWGLFKMQLPPAFIPIHRWLLWLFAGCLCLPLGFLPPSYLRTRKAKENYPTNLGTRWAYLASLLIMGVAVGFFWVSLYFIQLKPSILSTVNAVTAVILLFFTFGIGFAYWGWSIIHRLNKDEDSKQNFSGSAASSRNLFRTPVGWISLMLAVLAGALAMTTWEPLPPGQGTSTNVNSGPNTSQECSLNPTVCTAEGKAEWKQREEFTQSTNHNWALLNHGTHTIQYYDTNSMHQQDGVITVIQSSIAQDAQGAVFLRSTFDYPGKPDPYEFYNEHQLFCATGQIKGIRAWLADRHHNVVQITNIIKTPNKTDPVLEKLLQTVCAKQLADIAKPSPH